MRVGSMVRQVLGECTGLMHASRAAAVQRVTAAAIEAGDLVPAAIGRRIVGGAKPKHGIKCVDRLLANPHLASERLLIFRGVAARLLVPWSRPLVLVDWTQPMGTHQALVAALPIGGRSLPIYVEVHPQKKLGNSKVERKFLAALKAVLPTGCRPIVITDAGFKGPFFQDVLDNGWDFVGRIRGTSKAALVGDTEFTSKAELYARATPQPTDLGRCALFCRQRIAARLVIVRKRRKTGPKKAPPLCKEERELRQSALDPWLLATSLFRHQAASIVALYAKRMQIEEMFRDAKNPRFGWSISHVRTASVSRAANLLVIASVALVAVVLVGLAAERRKLHRAYQANTSGRRVLSFFALGRSIIARRDNAAVLLVHFLAALAAVNRLASA